MASGTEQSFFPRGLPAALGELERILTEDAEPLAELSRLADPLRLDDLFYVQLCKAVRTGPAEAGLAPRRLLVAAQRAAGVGVVPLATPSALRRLLAELEARLHEAGAWDPGAPPWWSPLPPPTPLERLWDGLSHGDGAPALPPAADLAAALAEPGVSSLWLALPHLLAPARTREIWRQLEDAERRGRLELEQGGVGASGRQTARRSDRVRYFSGLEPELLAAAPALAALVQWGLRHLAERLARSGRRVHPPRTAMLARYPAPSGGYAAHLDNPGGAHDNGRTLTLVIYLNAPGEECAGGELALWGEGTATSAPPAAVVAPRSGSAVLFDSRAIAHQVRPLAAGPARWALTFWLNDAPQQSRALLPRPELSLTDVLLPVAAPPLPPATVLFHELDDDRPAGTITVRRAPAARRRVGLVSTVYREGSRLDAWCAHHFALGADHLVLVFDHPEEPAETADAGRLRAAYGPDRLTIWPAAAAAERWGALPRDERLAELPRIARSGSSSYAVASRQTLNASVALAAARGDELGGAPLDWLLHLDADELFYLEGAGRGGATLGDHFAAAAAAGLELLRYANHEILLPHDPAAPRFKLNPRLAAARLGTGGWRQLVAHLAMAQTDPRPYFNGYFNGKSAVAVTAGAAAAGVHGWFLASSRGAAARRFLAGPSVLHFHFATPQAFRRKYLAIASSPVPAGSLLFELSPAEEATVELIRSLQRDGADQAALERRLDELHGTLTCFAEEDAELLGEAGLILRPELQS